MGTPLGPKYIPYTYMDPLGDWGFSGSENALRLDQPQRTSRFFSSRVTICHMFMFLLCGFPKGSKVPIWYGFISSNSLMVWVTIPHMGT